ncbi:MAG: hypothetical protein IVW56_04565 [Candidatus Binataceae bacterium]|nr:hypothetical protein [Candidatus Binataceae bacterium]
MNLGEILLPYQRAYLADQANVKVCEKSRRIGITWTEALDSVLHAAARTAPQSTWYVGYNREMAREFIDECAEWIARIGEGAGMPSEVLVQDEEADIQAYEIRFATRAKIVALSSTPRSLRGKAGRAVIDEAAFHRDLRALMKAALAFLMWGGAVRIISSHNGLDNVFNEIVIETREGKKPYSLHRYTFDDAVSDGLFGKICEAQNRRYSPAAERAWIEEVRADYGADAEEELDVVPRQLADAFLPAALIDARMTDDAAVVRWALDDSFVQLPDGDRAARGAAWCADNLAPILRRLAIGASGRASIGVDFARDSDLSVFWIAERGADHRVRTPMVVELRNIPFRQQDQALFCVADWIAARGNLTLAMDARGSGAYLCESARGRYGARVIACTMTREWYIDAMPLLRAAFEDGAIDIPRDPDIMVDLRSLRMEDGVVKPPEKRTRSAADRGKRHGDAAIAAALANWALKQRVVEYAYMRPPRARRGLFPGGESARRDRPPGETETAARPRGPRGLGSFF